MRGSRRLVALAGGLIAVFGAAEFAARTFGTGPFADSEEVARLQLRAQSGGGSMVPKPYYGFSLNPDRPNVGPMGFLGERPPRERSNDALRLSCLGASTTANGYPLFLEAELQKKLERDVECINWGVYGWTSAETLVNYFLNVQDYHSDIVLILHSWNDTRPRAQAGFRRDYTHFRSVWRPDETGAISSFLMRHSVAFTALREALGDSTDLDKHVVQQDGELKLEALMQSEYGEPFVRNIRSIAEHVTHKGGRAVIMTLPCAEDWRTWPEWPTDEAYSKFSVLGTRIHNESLRKLAREDDYPLIDLALWARDNRETLLPLYFDLIHLNKDGERLKAEFIAAELARLGLVGEDPAGG